MEGSEKERDEKKFNILDQLILHYVTAKGDSKMSGKSY